MTIAQYLSKNNEVSVFWNDKKDLDELIKRFSLNLSKVKLTKNIFSSDNSLINKLRETKKYDCIIFLSDGSIPISFSKKTFIHIQQPLPFVSANLKTKLKLKRINEIFCNSTFTKSYVDKELSVNSIVLYPPVEIKSEEQKKENIILHVGRFRVKNVVGLDDYKKQSVMIDTFKKLIDGGLKEWKLVVATSVKDEDKEKFEKVKDSASGYPIEFLVNKSNDQLWDIYSKAKIYWHASGFREDLEKHPEFAEHFGISTVEAMGAGAVPVVINAGGQKEIVEEGINGFLWNTIQEFEEKTLSLINNDNLLKKLSDNAKKRAKYFSDDKFCERINDLVNS